MNKDNQKFINDLKLKIASSNYIESVNTKEEKVKNRFFINKKIIATTCASLVLVSGIAIATNIDKITKKDRGLGEGIETAVENGYISKPHKEFTNIDNVDANIILDNFLMDDVNLSTNIIFNFNNLSEKIDLNNVYEVELKDLIIRDEENRILYGGNDKERFEKYCVENNLEYIFGEFNDNYINSGVNCFIESKENNKISLLYNMYSTNYPKSKKLYFSVNEITLKTEQKIFVVKGIWQVFVDVPEEMYNRTEEYYKVVSCDNNDFEVYTAKVTNTGFEFGVIISNIKNPNSEESNEIIEKIGKINEDYSLGKISYSEATELWNNYTNLYNQNHPISITNRNLFTKEEVPSSYIQNTNGKKFECSKNVSRNSRNQFLSKNSFNFYETFDMTKYDATDKIRVVLYYYGTPVEIELKK